jgi:hypothetical protein
MRFPVLRFLPGAVSAIIVLGLFAAPASAARDEPIKNPSDIPIAWNKDRKPTMDEIQRAIISGCATRGWQCKAASPGEVRAVLYVRQHMAESLIKFDTGTFSVTYVNSSELRYNGDKNTIHRKYNLWVANLIGDINAAVATIH